MLSDVPHRMPSLRVCRSLGFGPFPALRLASARLTFPARLRFPSCLRLSAGLRFSRRLRFARSLGFSSRSRFPPGGRFSAGRRFPHTGFPSTLKSERFSAGKLLKKLMITICLS